MLLILNYLVVLFYWRKFHTFVVKRFHLKAEDQRKLACWQNNKVISLILIGMFDLMSLWIHSCCFAKRLFQNNYVMSQINYDCTREYI